MNNQEKQEQHKNNRDKAGIFVGIGALLLLLGPFSIIAFIIFGLGALVFNYNNSEYQKLHVGSEGEKLVQTFLVDLPEGYQCLSNVEVEFEGQKCEIDNVIISKRGVCIIETKTLTGKITGGENDNEWRRRKTSRGGHWYFSTIRNPIKQTKRQVYILSHYLESKGLRTWIDFYVFLNKANCKVESDKIVLNKDDLLKKIKESGRDNSLSNKKIDNIVGLFKEETEVEETTEEPTEETSVQ